MEGVQIMKFGYIKLISLQAKTSSSGPAFTLLINGTVNRKNIQMDIDLVPCFVFQESKWPTGGYRQNIVQNKVGVNCTSHILQFYMHSHFVENLLHCTKEPKIKPICNIRPLLEAFISGTGKRIT